MALPNLGPSTAQEELSDKAKELGRELAEVSKQMAKMSAADAPALEGSLRKIAERADKIGPILAKLFVLDPKGARGLKEQFQSIIDSASEMAGKVQEKAREATQAAAKADRDQHDKTLRGAARGIRNLPTGGVGGAAVGALALAGPEGEVAAAAFSAVTQAISQATDALSDYATTAVKAANPGVWDRYERSLQDLSSVFGQAFTPVVQAATEYADKLNGVLTEIAPILSEIVGELVSDFKPIMEAVFSLAESIASAMKDAWGGMKDGFKSAMQEIAGTIVGIIKLVQELITILAVMNEQEKKTGHSDVATAAAEAKRRIAEADKAAKDSGGNKTFAARPAEFSNVEDIGKKVALAAASAGGKQNSVEDNTQTIADAAAEFVKKWDDLVQDASTCASAIGPIATALNTLANIGVGGSKSTGSDIADVARDAVTGAASRRAALGIWNLLNGRNFTG